MSKTMSLHKYIDNILFDCLFYLQNVQAATPVIVKENKSKYLIQVEGQSLMRKPLEKFSVAIQAWFDSYWAFALEFPGGIKNTCLNDTICHILLCEKLGQRPNHH